MTPSVEHLSQRPARIPNPTPLGFPLGLLQAGVKATPNRNVFISPVSMQVALSILFNGAEGQTRLQMANVLNGRNIPTNVLNNATNELLTALSRDSSVQLQIANSLWIREGFSVKSNFVDRSRRFFNALVAVRNFTNPNLPNEINQWVSQNTAGTITKMIDQVSADDVMFIMNAIYFKGNWQKAFDKSLTKPSPFQLADGTTKTIPLMSAEVNLPYLETDRFQAVRLPYSNGRFGMLIFLPKPNQNLGNFIAGITPENWQNWLRGLRRQNGRLAMPRLRMEYEADLKPTLQNLGIRDAFIPQQANFRDITNARVFVSFIRHKTFVEVNEEGTEAAGSTGIGVAVTSVPVETKRFSMVVDRPFLTAIHDQQTNSLLFIGAIYEPQF